MDNMFIFLDIIGAIFLTIFGFSLVFDGKKVTALMTMVAGLLLIYNAEHMLNSKPEQPAPTKTEAQQSVPVLNYTPAGLQGIAATLESGEQRVECNNLYCVMYYPFSIQQGEQKLMFVIRKDVENRNSHWKLVYLKRDTGGIINPEHSCSCILASDLIAFDAKPRIIQAIALYLLECGLK
jgi:hypothetical protein